MTVFMWFFVIVLYVFCEELGKHLEKQHEKEFDEKIRALKKSG